MIGKWYEAATKFNSQHRRLQEIITRKKGIMGFQIQTKKSNTLRFSRSGFLKEWSVPTSELLIKISSMLVAEMGNNSICITLPIGSKTTKGNKTVATPVLLNTGAGGIFMNKSKSYAKKHNIKFYKLNTPIIPHDVDGTLNQGGKIMHYTWIRMKFQDITILIQLLITNIRSQDIIFGLPWFKDYDPQINWNTGKITIQKKAKTGWLKYS